MIITKKDFNKVNEINTSLLVDELRGYGLEVQQGVNTLDVSYKPKIDGNNWYSITIGNGMVAIFATVYDEQPMAYGTPSIGEVDFESHFAYTCLALIRERG